MQSLITQGLDFPQRLITQGFNAPDPRYCHEWNLDNGLILQGFSSNNLVLQGFSAAQFKHTRIYFDSEIQSEYTFDSPIEAEDLITEEFNIWV